MKTQKWILNGALFLVTSLLMACSGVDFNPVELSKNDADGAISDNKVANESFYPNPVDSRPKVDILFVIDNSASMTDIQAKVGERLSSFVNSLSNIDWQIGITTTDTSDGPFGIKGSLVQLHGLNQYILNKNTPNYELVFKNTVVRQEGINCGANCPSVRERPIEAATMAIQKGAANGFLRHGAELAIVILSDADEGGDGFSVPTMSPHTLLSTAGTIFNQQKRITGYGIVVEPGDLACLNLRRQSSPHSYYGQNATLLANLTGGVTGSVCDLNYGPTLKRIGDHVLNLVSSIQLSHEPIPESVEITLSPSDPDVTWSISGKTVEFPEPPKPGTRVDIKYIIKD